MKFSEKVRLAWPSLEAVTVMLSLTLVFGLDLEVSLTNFVITTVRLLTSGDEPSHVDVLWVTLRSSATTR